MTDFIGFNNLHVLFGKSSLMETYDSFSYIGSRRLSFEKSFGIDLFCH